MTGFIWLALIACAYLFPTLVAAGRHHHNQLAVGMLNLLLGWTVLGWILSLVWACTAVRK